MQKGGRMIPKRQLAGIKTLGKIQGFESDIRTFSESMESAPLWRPGAALKKQCDEVLRLIAELEERFDRKLVVTILGPCGSGKSTLLNALAGVDDLSRSGHDRPTTRNLVVLCRDENDGGPLLRDLGSENTEIRHSHGASVLEHVLLIDTPDTDSSEGEAHVPMVRRAIKISDVLICLFNAENPKTRDYADFLAPYVQWFGGESLVCLLNKCDRLSEKELREVILPGFRKYIGKAWEKPADKVLCISARRHLHAPQWDKKAKPRHDFDQFGELQEMIFSTFNQAGYVIDRRLENAESLRDYVSSEVLGEIGKDRETLEDARKRITETETKAAKKALTALKSDDSKQMLGVNVLLYQKLAQRWLGPVGWLIALWARILIFGTGIAAIFRFGNPIQQIIGIISSLWHFKDSQAAVTEVSKGERANTVFRDYRLSVMKSWPDIAESLIRGRFDQSVRKLDDVLPDGDSLNDELAAMWSRTLDGEIESAARKLSGLVMQFVFNAPVIGIMGYTGWITGKAFFAGIYLTSDFFLHAFLTIGLAMFLNFFIFQGFVRLIGGTDRITGRAFEDVKKQIEQFRPISVNPVGEQVETVLALKPDDEPEM